MHQCYVCGEWRVSQALVKEQKDLYSCRAMKPCLKRRETREYETEK